jgi:hypothetical protein
MSARRPDGATFEVSRLGRRRRRPPIAPIAWSGLLVGLIAFAVLGRISSGGAAVGEASAAATGVDVAGLGSLVPAPGDPVFLPPSRPAGPPQLDATINLQTSTGDSEGSPDRPAPRRLWVTGNVFVHATVLVVSLESPDGRVVDSRTISAVDPDGGIRPLYGPRLQLSFALPAPTGDGRIWVDVSALDSSGRIVAQLRREVAIGPAPQTWLRRPMNLMS